MIVYYLYKREDTLEMYVRDPILKDKEKVFGQLWKGYIYDPVLKDRKKVFG